MVCAADNEVENHCLLTGNEFPYGKSVGKLHNHSKVVHLEARKIDIESLIFSPLKIIEKTFLEKRNELKVLNNIAFNIAKKIQNIETSHDISRAILHGDLTGGNATIDSKGNFIFYDFDCSGYGWAAYDLAVFLWSAITCGKETSSWKAFIEGYCSIDDIDEAEFELTPLLASARNFWIMAYSINQRSIKGELSYSCRQFQQDINFFQKLKTLR